MKFTKMIVKLLFWEIILLLALALAGGQGNAAQEYQFYDLGTLGGSKSEAHGINANGWVVGMAQTASGDWHAFLKKPDDQNMEDLGTLGENFSSASGINASGWVVGEAKTAEGIHAFLKQPGFPMEDLSTLGGTNSYAYGINDSNWVIGASETTTANVLHAFLKKPEDQSMQDLFTLGGSFSWAFGINAGGSVVGQAFTSSGTFHAFLKNPDDQQMQDLSTLGGDFSSAYGINASGWVVGESETTPGGDWHAFLKRGPTADMEDLGTLGYDSCAFGINASGWVVGASQISYDQHAFVKKLGDTMQDLNNLVQLPEGVVLVRALAINDDGYIVGYTLDTATQPSHAFLLKPNTNNVVTRQSVITAIQNLQAQISTLDPKAFKNANMQNALLNKLNTVIGYIDAGDYVDALDQLQQDILGKLTGKNCWITDPAAQTQIYKNLTTIITELKML